MAVLVKRSAILIFLITFHVRLAFMYRLHLSDPSNSSVVAVELDLDEEDSKQFEDGELQKSILETLLSVLQSRNLQEPTEQSTSDAGSSLDSWSIVWYIASFGGLVAFFLIVSCSEWCCRKGSSANPRSYTGGSSPLPTPNCETPPPSYEHFAPPSYESLRPSDEKATLEIYVIPVNTRSNSTT